MRKEAIGIYESYAGSNRGGEPIDYHNSTQLGNKFPDHLHLKLLSPSRGENMGYKKIRSSSNTKKNNKFIIDLNYSDAKLKIGYFV